MDEFTLKLSDFVPLRYGVTSQSQIYVTKLTFAVGLMTFVVVGLLRIGYSLVTHWLR